MPKIKFNCAYCGTETEKYSTNASKYCSPECYQAAKRESYPEHICPVCGTTFKGKKEQVYCSSLCKIRRNHEREKQPYTIICPRCKTPRPGRAARSRQYHTLCRKCVGIQASERAFSHFKGSLSYAWKGGRRIDSYGYVKLHMPNHPFADSTNYVREHLYVVADAYGAEYVRENGGVVHHINGKKQDNRLENLFICTAKQNADYSKALLEIAYQLVQAGVIEFIDGKYRCPLLGDETGEASQTR